MHNTWLLVGIAIYFAAMVYIGYRMAARNKGAEDFLVGGRSFGMFFNTGMLLACWMGGALILGNPGTYLAFGFWDSAANWGQIVGFGGSCCLLVAGLFYMKRLWQLKLLSLGDFFYLRYGRQTGVISTVLMCFTFTIWVAVQVVSFAKVGTTLLGLSLSTCVVISVVVICTYTILGGLYAVCFTDIVQVIIVFIGILVLTPLTVSMAGGVGEVVASVPEQHWNFFPTGGSVHGWLAWTAAWCTIGLGSVCSPDLLQRAFCAKSGKVARNSAIMAWVIMILLQVIMFFLSYACINLMNSGTIDTTMIEADVELLVPVIVQELLPLPIAVLFIGAVLAAVMSAAATANIALSGVIAKNLIKDIFVRDMSSRALMQTTRVVIVIVGLIASYISIALPSAFVLTSFGFDLILSCLFMPLTLGLYWKKANGYGAIAGMLIGAGVRIVGSGLVNGFSVMGIGSPTEIWYLFTLGGPLASGVAMFIVSLLTQNVNKPIELELDEEPA